VAIVHDLVAHVDGSAVLGQRPLDDIDRANDASAESTRLSQYDLHALDLLVKALAGSVRTADAGLSQTRAAP
jgi:hypothetical protein